MPVASNLVKTLKPLALSVVLKIDDIGQLQAAHCTVHSEASFLAVTFDEGTTINRKFLRP